MNNKRILILYTSIGLGHKYIALNIAYHLEKAGFEIKLHDVLQLQSGLTVKLGEWFHSIVNKHFPFIWRWLYLSKWFSKITMPLRVPLAGRNRKNVKQVIDDWKPHMVIATQTSASAPVAYMKRHGEYRGEFVIAFSDYHFHPYWFYREADFYLVNIEEQKYELEKFGVPQDKIAVCGITLRPQEKTADVQSVKRNLGLTDKRVILMSSGSMGIGFPKSKLLSYAAELPKKIPNAVLLVVCGKNETMKHQLERETELNKLQMKVLGFYEPMSELYEISEVFLTKPGGLTVSEALRDGVKMLTTHFLPGQEELNYEYLTNRNLMEPIPSPDTTQNLVRKTLELMDKKIEVENPNSREITQKNSEGTAVIKSIENLFHIV